MTTESTDTRARLVDAGEMLFAEHGFAGTSVRAVTAAAGTNLNAVNYHFGSKEGLFRAVVSRIMGPVNEEQSRRLTALETATSETSGTLSVEDLIGAYASPLVDLLERDKERGRVVSRLVARVLADVGASFERAAFAEADAAEERYLRAFARALPHLSIDELWWRLQTTAVVIAFHQVVVVASGRSSETRPDPEGDFRTWMLTYITAAMCAPSRDAAARSRAAHLTFIDSGR